MANSYEQQAIDLVKQNEALKAQVNALRKMLISVSCDSGVAVEMDINELITSAPERCLNSVKKAAVNEFIDLVINDDNKNAGLGDLLRLLHNKD